VIESTGPSSGIFWRRSPRAADTGARPLARAALYALSKTVATPWPKPMHIVATPVVLSFAFMR
jgi:hypothetical protein